MPFNFLLNNDPFYGKPHPSHVAKHDGRHLYSTCPWEMTVGGEEFKTSLGHMRPCCSCRLGSNFQSLHRAHDSASPGLRDPTPLF